MPKIIKKEEIEVKSVWANGEYIIGPVEKIFFPTSEKPFWQIILKDGNFLTITGQVVVKQGHKDPVKSLSDKTLNNKIETITKGK